MKFLTRFILAVGILIISCPWSIAGEPRQGIQSGFPPSKGSYWIYQGVTKWTKPNSNEVIERTLKWKMEVIETINREQVTAAIVKGFPEDLAWYEEGKERGDYLIIQVGKDKTIF